MTPRELEDRLINFAVSIIRLSDGIKPSIAGNNLSGQILKTESNELISIFVKSIETSKRKQGTLPPKVNR
jgi:hypothetical protein